MKRGEIYFADLDPTVGDELRKKRPVLIVSNNANNRVANTITIVPITSNVTKVYPFEVFLPIAESKLVKDSKAQCHQARTISKKRIGDKELTGKVTKLLMNKINSALVLHLGIT